MSMNPELTLGSMTSGPGHCADITRTNHTYDYHRDHDHDRDDTSISRSRSPPSLTPGGQQTERCVCVSVLRNADT